MFQLLDDNLIFNVSQHANVYEFKQDITFTPTMQSSVICLWVKITIPLTITKMNISSTTTNVFTLEVYKNMNPVLEIHGPPPTHRFVKVYRSSLHSGELIRDLHLTPSIYIFQITSIGLNHSGGGELRNHVLKDNMFFSIFDGTNQAYNTLEQNNQINVNGPAKEILGALMSMEYQYRKTDTFLGIQDKRLNRGNLIPGAWYFLLEKSDLRIILWDGSFEYEK